MVFLVICLFLKRISLDEIGRKRKNPPEVEFTNVNDRGRVLIFLTRSPKKGVLFFADILSHNLSGYRLGEFGNVLNDSGIFVWRSCVLNVVLDVLG